MVREIVHAQVGQCGNQVGCAFWNAVLAEHCLTPTGIYDPDKNNIRGNQDLANPQADADQDGVPDVLEKVDVYFSIKNQGDQTKSRSTFVPRCMIVDLEPGTVDVIKASPLGTLFKPDNMKFGANGAGNNWAKGHYTEGAELIEEVVQKCRSEAENAEALQGFQFCHSLGGGTGSGLGTLLLLKIRDAFPDRMLCTYSVYPSPKVSDTVVEPYNAVLSCHQLLENSEETFIVDNEALYNIATNVLKQTGPTYTELNGLIAQAMCGVTSSLRFPGQLNGDLRKLGVNLVPFPRLHFFLPSQAPLLSQQNTDLVRLTIQEITNQVWSKRNFFCNVSPNEGKVLAASVTYRGKSLSAEEVDENTLKIQTKREDEFVEWIPNNIKTSIVNVPPTTSTSSGTFVGNTTALKGIYQRLATQFGAMYKRKAFLHWYKGEGMDEMEFQEADKNVRDLITEYQDKEDATVEVSGDENEADEDESI